MTGQPNDNNLKSKTLDIPSLPTGMAGIVSVASSENATAEDVAQAIMLDPALSTKVLRMANSAFYGRLTKAETITQAVVTLGFSAVKTLALAASVMDHVLPDKSVDGLDWRAFWLHCVATGAASEMVSRRISGSRRGGEALFVAGLLHDVGKLVIARNVPEEYAQAVALAREENIELHEAESRVLGTDHTAVGALLTQEWRIPEVVARPVTDHHSKQPYTEIENEVVSVRAANMLTKLVYGGYLVETESGVTDELIAEATGLDLADVADLVDELPDRVSECEEILKWASGLPVGAKKAA